MKALKIFLYLFFVSNLSVSCYQDKGDFFRTNSIILSADSSEKRPGQTIVLTVNTDAGIEITNQAIIYIKEVTSSTIQISNTPAITTTDIKSYTIYAKYVDANSNKEFISNEIEVSFNNDKSFVKRVLIEDYTGAWCVNCPTVSYAIEQLKANSVRAVPVAIHRGSNPASFDPYHFAGADILEELVGVANQYPTAKLNRITNWNYPQTTTTNQNKAIALTAGAPVRLGLAMNSTVQNSKINLDVKVKFFDDYTDNLRLVVYVLENNLIYPQKNSTSFYGGLSVIPNFKHDHVVRATFTNILGDRIPAFETVYNATYSRNFNITIPANIANSANIEFVAFVIGSNNKAINVRSAAIEANQLFEDNP